MIEKLTIQVTKTADGLAEYVQVMSSDLLTVNVVLIADQIEILDGRPAKTKKRKKRTSRKGQEAQTEER